MLPLLPGGGGGVGGNYLRGNLNSACAMRIFTCRYKKSIDNRMNASAVKDFHYQ